MRAADWLQAYLLHSPAINESPESGPNILAVDDNPFGPSLVKPRMRLHSEPEQHGQFLELLRERGELCVSDIVEAFDASQPTISHHLRLLRNVGLVNSRKQGKLVYYELNQENVSECCGMLVTKFAPSFPIELTS